jgi:hypothetical protein
MAESLTPSQSLSALWPQCKPTILTSRFCPKAAALRSHERAQPLGFVFAINYCVLRQIGSDQAQAAPMYRTAPHRTESQAAQARLRKHWRLDWIERTWSIPASSASATSSSSSLSQSAAFAISRPAPLCEQPHATPCYAALNGLESAKGAQQRRRLLEVRELRDLRLQPGSLRVSTSKLDA